MVKKAAQARPNDLLRRARQERGWSQRVVADRIGAPQDTMITRWERGNAIPSPYYIERLCQLFGMSATELGLLPQESAVEAAPADFTTLKSLPHRVHNLPVLPTSFLGREHEVNGICDLLRRPEVRLVTLTGTGGIGKTRLALQVAAEVSDQFADGVFFVALAPVSDEGLVMPTIMQTLSIKESGEQPLLTQLKAALKERQMLLLLDNFEQVVEAAAQLAELLTACPRLKILVTSRIVLHVQAEYEFAVPPLSLPNQKRLSNLGAFLQYEAVALFIQRAQVARADFQVTNTNAPTVAAICARSDGLPLAIELAAARVKQLPLSMLLKRSEQGLSVLSGGFRDLPPRQQTMRNTIAWSYNLLTPEEQHLFRCFAVFVDGCTWEAAAEVCTVTGQWQGDVLEGLISLVDKSLLRQEEATGGEGRFWMLQLLREFGLEELAAKGELQAVQEAHARYYLRLALAVGQQTKEERLLDFLEREYGNLRGALAWMLEEMSMERVEMAIQLCEVLSMFWRARGQNSEGVTFLERIVAEARDVGVALRAKALLLAADLTEEQGDFHRSERHALASLALYRELGDNSGSAQALLRLAWVAGTGGDGATARKLKEEAAALLEKTSDKSQLASVLFGLADELCAQGEYARGLGLFEESLALSRELGNKTGIADALMQSAWYIYQSKGNAATARARVDEALPLVREVGDKFSLANHYWVSALIALGERELARAHTLAEESVERYREKEMPWYRAWTLIVLAQVEAQQGDAAAALNHFKESLELAREINDKWLIPWDLEGLAGLAAARGEAAWAVRLWGAAEALRENSRFPMPPVERSSYEQAVAAIRSKLSEEAFAAIWVQGRTTPLDQVIYDALNR
ncbi:MAG TPA: NB-ARC domain-containing protein [Ktedonobacteraceae bacterium]|nr:NB-ARC domain-containing protein [Ktedonobacteraceae bacterium]